MTAVLVAAGSDSAIPHAKRVKINERARQPRFTKNRQRIDRLKRQIILSYSKENDYCKKHNQTRDAHATPHCYQAFLSPIQSLGGSKWPEGRLCQGTVAVLACLRRLRRLTSAARRSFGSPWRSKAVRSTYKSRSA